ncbi:response regulator [Aliamphritea ceti]|uniref:response regulator n=1 Tax=Aliamphritea ceti TaxID=1524258 RepID=UPI0021C41A4E|nr:response regulator transcription factor [Aliamphritea ceti]
MRILVLEDDSELGNWIQTGLTDAGHVVDWLEDGRHALAAATTQEYDVVLLDRMTPGLDGLSVLKAMRAAKNNVPVLILSALGDVECRVQGLDAGSDDYLAKPFAFTELLARINALGRRSLGTPQESSQVLVAGDLELDLLKRQCVRQGKSIELNTKEFLLLEILLRNPGRIQTKAMLLEKVWDLRFDPTTSVVETHISRLRGKVDKPFNDTLIRTVRGAGYVIDQVS